MTTTTSFPRRAWLAGLAATVLAGGCAMMAPRVETYTPPPLGSTWTSTRVNTGSYGTGTAQVVTRRGERAWQGKPAITFEAQDGTIVANPADANWYAIVAPNGQPVFSWDPPVGPVFPMEVGKTWVARTRITNHMANVTVPVEATWKVEAYEDVTVPAGTFRTFRVAYVDNMGNSEVYWMSPELHMLFVKAVMTRTAAHRLGPGTREQQLVSQSIRK
jgi:hypothetical protein